MSSWTERTLEYRDTRRRRAVEAAVGRWSHGAVSPGAEQPDVYVPSRAARPQPPALARSGLAAGRIRVLLRAFSWLVHGLRLAAVLASDLLRGRSDARSRAARLREALQAMGGTPVKLGQQLSVRADLLSHETCSELAALLDDAPPMPWPAARAAVEAAVGGLDAAFPRFEQDPIGSASVACVYRATRRDGREVAVKVLRPDAGTRFAADLALVDLCARALEGLGILRAGQGRSVVRHLGAMLADEVDLRQEARYQELFRRSLRKTRIDYLDAPAVHFDLSTRDVLVTDFVDGVQAATLLRAVDEGDRAALAGLAARGIDPRQVGERLVTAWNWQVLDFTVFHADPHPANLLIQPGGRLVLVDFGACGAFSERGRRLLREVQYHLMEDDFRAMARAAMGLLEPYPPMDLDAFAQELEGLYARFLHASRSRHAEWWERATSRIWFDFVGLARKYGIPASLDTLRLFRATFLLDTLAFRLHPTMTLAPAYRRFLREERRWKRRRFERRAGRNPVGTPLLGFERIEAATRLADRLGQRLAGLLDTTEYALGVVPEKFYQLLSSTLRGATSLALLVLGVTAVAEVVQVPAFAGGPAAEYGAFFGKLGHDHPDLAFDSVGEVVSHPLFQIALVGALLVWVVKVRRRLDEVGERRRQ